MSITTGFASVANCYVFKSRLQEYAQKAGFLTPVYETVKEGPSHEPCFSSSVVVDNVKYNSLPGFYNRKAAEQSAAEVALLELAKSGKIDESISCPVHETGLCKNLLQEYAQKMNYAMPSYVCRTHEAPGRKPFHSCTVDIGGIQYIGATATTKKEAELKAARTALLAIQSNTSGAESNPNGSHELTVLPCKRKAVEPDAKKETAQLIKPKKAKLKKSQKKKSLQNRIDLATGNVESSLVPQGEDTGMLETIKDGHCGEHLRSQLNGNEQVPVTDPNNNFQHAQTIPLNSNLSDQGYSNMDVDSGVQVNDLVQLEKIVDEVGVEQMATFGAAEVPFVNGEKFDSDSSLVDLLNQNEYVGNEVKVEHGVEQVATFVAAEVPGFNGENFDSDSSLVDLLNQNEYVGNEVKVEHGVEQVATFVAAEVPGFNGENFDSDNSLVGLNQTEDVGNEVKVEHGVEQVATFVAAEVPGFNGEKFDSNTSLVGLNQTEDVRSEVRVEHGVEQVATFVAAEVPGSNGEKFDSNNSLVGLNQTEDVRSEVKVEHGVEQVATVGAAEVPVVNGETLDSKHNLVGLHQNEDVCREV